jgi:hypothetical protein
MINMDIVTLLKMKERADHVELMKLLKIRRISFTASVLTHARSIIIVKPRIRFASIIEKMDLFSSDLGVMVMVLPVPAPARISWTSVFYGRELAGF